MRSSAGLGLARRQERLPGPTAGTLSGKAHGEGRRAPARRRAPGTRPTQARAALLLPLPSRPRTQARRARADCSGPSSPERPGQHPRVCGSLCSPWVWDTQTMTASQQATQRHPPSERDGLIPHEPVSPKCSVDVTLWMRGAGGAGCTQRHVASAELSLSQAAAGRSRDAI